jgi:hypothetical protein
MEMAQDSAKSQVSVVNSAEPSTDFLIRNPNIFVRLADHSPIILL